MERQGDGRQVWSGAEPGLSGLTGLEASSSPWFAVAVSHLPGNYLSFWGTCPFVKKQGQESPV